MKKLFAVALLSLVLAGQVYAHCGKCGVEGGKDAAAAHSGKQCPMHAEKNAVLSEAAKALETSKPDLSAKLNDMASKCCSGH